MLSRKPITIAKRDTSIWQSRWFRSTLLILIVGVALVALTYAALKFTDTTTTIVVINESDCPEITFSIQAGVTGDVRTVKVKKGQQEKLDVDPDVVYRYFLNTESEPDEQNMACFNRDSGTVKLPAGSSQTFRIRSERNAVAIVNDRVCPEILFKLRLRTGGSEQQVNVKPGATAELDVQANLEYEYSAEIALAADANNTACALPLTGSVTVAPNTIETIQIATAIADETPPSE